MRIILTSLFLSMALHAYGQKQKRMAIAFYNVENLFDTLDDPDTDDDAFTPKGAYKYTTDIYRQKLHNTAFVLKQIAETKTIPAVIGLAEIENVGVLTDLVNNDQLKKYGYQHISFDSPDPRGIDAALLYQPKWFKPFTAKPVTIHIRNNGHSETTRDILFVSGMLDGRDTVHILVNHWPSRREGKGETAPKRKQMAAENKRIVDSIMKRNPASQVIVMGDLNDDPVDESILNILGANDGRERIIPYTLYNPWTEIYTSGQGTTAYQNKWNLFDQIILSRQFLKKGSGWKFAKAEVINDEFLITRQGKHRGYPYRSWRGYHWMNGYSDHLPVILYLEK